jgi:hypothetical protein
MTEYIPAIIAMLAGLAFVVVSFEWDRRRFYREKLGVADPSEPTVRQKRGAL